MFMIFETRHHRLALLLMLTSAVWTLFAATVASARDDTPVEIMNQSNPVELEETDIDARETSDTSTHEL